LSHICIVEEIFIMPKHISSREARNRFSDLMGMVRYGGEEVIVERSGRPVAAVIPLDTYERLVKQRREHFKVLDDFRLSLPDVSPEEVSMDAQCAIEEVRNTDAEGGC